MMGPTSRRIFVPTSTGWLTKFRAWLHREHNLEVRVTILEARLAGLVEEVVGLDALPKAPSGKILAHLTDKDENTVLAMVYIPANPRPRQINYEGELYTQARVVRGVWIYRIGEGG